jgi:hypothetical protein
MSWFEIDAGRLRFRRRVTKDPIREWLLTAEGSSAVAEAARGARFSLFGRRRAARRRVFGVLWQAISAPAVRKIVAAECEGYLDAWTPLAYAPSLPRLSIEYRRLVVVPRAMIAWRIASRSVTAVAASLESGEVHDSFRAFFARWVVARMDDTVRQAGPSPQRPLYAKESWACVGLDGGTLWVDMALLPAPEWQGHVVMFEMPSNRLQRRERQALEAALANLSDSLSNLTRLQRGKVLKVAMDQLLSVRA